MVPFSLAFLWAFTQSVLIKQPIMKMYACPAQRIQHPEEDHARPSQPSPVAQTHRVGVDLNEARLGLVGLNVRLLALRADGLKGGAERRRKN